MKTTRVLVMEYIVALGVSSWSALKAKQAPWPPTVIKTGIAFALIGAVAAVSEELAVTLGAGFLLAQLVRVLGGKTPYTGGIPDNGKVQWDSTVDPTFKRPIALVQSKPELFRYVWSWARHP